VKVLRFSVGFGRPLVTWRLGADRTEWVIAAVPFGGYVKMLDEREGAVAPAEAYRAFNRQSVWRRIAIVVAGPVFNLAFAVLVYAGLFMYGLPEARPVLGEPPPGSVAAAAGLHTQDTVLAVGGVTITTWQELRWRVLQAALQRESLRLGVQTQRGNLAEATLDLRGYPTDDIETDALEHVGLRLYRPPLDPVIGQVVAGQSIQPDEQCLVILFERVHRRHADGEPDGAGQFAPGHRAERRLVEHRLARSGQVPSRGQQPGVEPFATSDGDPVQQVGPQAREVGHVRPVAADHQMCVDRAVRW